MDLERLLTDRLAPAFAAVAGVPVDPAVRRSQHADFQSDAALGLARRLSRPPREIAAEVRERAALADVCASVEVSGPGFLNLTVADHALGGLVSALAADPRLGVPPVAEPETVVVDYSAPNVAKEMHVGHLRSTVIGDAAARTLEWLGHRVLRANHLGDWGTPFGMLIEHLLDLGEAGAAQELSMGDLDGFYKAARAKFDDDEAFRERSRRRVVALQGGDPATLRLWRLLVTQSESYFLTVYDLLDVTLTGDDFRGESSYHDQLAPTVEELDRLGLLRRSEGADCVFPPGSVGRDGEPLPLIVRKSDGGFGYPATDLAALRHRTGTLGATRLLYVVGLPQRRHFEMVFAVGAQAGWLTAPVRAEHVGFGSILGPDGRMLRSRAGGSVKLVGLLTEAVERATALARERNPELGEAEAAEVGRAVGIGAIKYADLSGDRHKDYVLDWERMLSLDGNTAPYLQYAYSRVRSIFRRAGAAARPDADVSLAEPAERALAMELVGFAAVVEEVAGSLEFHRLTAYLHRLAVAFSAFYERCPVLRADGPVRESRLVLCELTGRVLRQGLDLLGIRTPERL
ncbi:MULTISPECIES: arginine--tRNA ligase [Micromonospora]|uniref:arginine--tRNA ligase n=1 Tax=Micromonospora TaxID=1873 RepID=UPI0003EEC8B3|nr:MULTISPECIES: arginine--tRNA ligase [unclassified Micromonospora]EWM66980.1 arginine--tRNA ligase [Micromonospora sp. M42]MCK1804925.1 arginine--tRNA ligase [Micromonospora sp. R42106]MCK1832953.1 arginine--tRNA ligase [Micromonospora sp. R42003]MCK1845548.1 arginine--tRNA ligase [Micromonospora sp. R42004]MCM1020102.1 arginine--tRNA ligase [Micromonospora sp. XM-20-01]